MILTHILIMLTSINVSEFFLSPEDFKRHPDSIRKISILVRYSEVSYGELELSHRADCSVQSERRRQCCSLFTPPLTARLFVNCYPWVKVKFPPW